MYMGIDIGGTKVLMASFTDEGKLVQQHKFPTPKLYSDFLQQFKQELNNLSNDDFKAAGLAIPGVVDREHGLGVRFGNLDWNNVPIQRDLEKILGCPVTLENDAKAGAIYEAYNIKGDFKNVLYIAIGTGIGIAYVSDGIIDTKFGDRGGNRIMLDRGGKLESWESFAAGKAIVARFGKKASEITDPKIWKIIAHDIALGLLDLIALFETDIVVFGGGVGAHFDRFEDFLKQELKHYETPILKMPKLMMAKNPEEAVIYGCYLLAKSLSP